MTLAQISSPEPRPPLLWYCRGRMDKEGYYFGLPPLARGAAALFLRWNIVGAFLICLAAFIFYFFRDPERVISAEPGAIVSPADGRIVVVTDEANAGRPGKRISIFLAIWNVHVNRSPASGTITGMKYRPGKFSAAMRDSASTHNEQNVIDLATAAAEITFNQIAGLIPPPVASSTKPGHRVARRERIGLGRFGTPADPALPLEPERFAKSRIH